jgi:hypothetical protein
MTWVGEPTQEFRSESYFFFGCGAAGAGAGFGFCSGALLAGAAGCGFAGCFMFMSFLLVWKAITYRKSQFTPFQKKEKHFS